MSQFSEKVSSGARVGRTRSPVERPIGRLASAFREGISAVMDLVFPPVCSLCNDPVDGSRDFCVPCEGKLMGSEASMASACHRCGSPSVMVVGTPRGRMPEIPPDLPASSVDSLAPKAECPVCSQSPGFFSGATIDHVIPLWAYQGLVCDAIVAAKYAHNSALGDALGRRLARCIGGRLQDDAVDLVEFVPSHFTRQFSRGGIGSRTIALAVARHLNVPCRGHLRMNRRVAKQAWLDDEKRRKNVHGAFSLRKSYASPRTPVFANRHVLLVDDVLTTGATASEVASVMKAAGARCVTLGVVARAVRG